MALQAPSLDDRKFQDIVSEARSKISLYCPEWTDYNLSDPGITLIELFAWMTDMMLYRMNKVPEKNYIKFMELIGIKLEPPRPARVDVTFRLSTPQANTVVIPKGTEVATVRTETQEAISFTTDDDLRIIVPSLAYAMTTLDDATFSDCMPALKRKDKPVTIFKQVPGENNAIYYGFGESLNGQTLRLNVDSNIEGIGVVPDDAPLVYETWSGIFERWVPLRLEQDTTGGLNTRGYVTLYLPYDGTVKEIGGTRAFWVRCRATRPRPGQRAYSNSPKISSVAAQCIGGTVPASHCLRMAAELLGRSNGRPGQKFQLRNAPVLTRGEGERLEVETETEGEYESWEEVTGFWQSRDGDPHYVLDGVTGDIELGPRIRQSNGQERQFGRIPPLGRRLRFTSYRWGGGVIGNVGKKTISVLKSSIPYVASVANFNPAIGGTDAETLEAAKLRAPAILRNHMTAVTASDFEYLAVQASPHVARAKCISAGKSTDGQAVPPGVVRVLIVPRVEDVDRPISRDKLRLLANVRSAVQEYLDERKLLTARVEIAAPEYRQIAVEATVRVRPGCDFERVADKVKQNLYRYLNPVCGGPRGQGWPFGRSLFVSEVNSVVQNTDEVDYLEDVKVYSVDSDSGEGQPVEGRMTIPLNGLICSAEHRVNVMLVEGYE